MASWTRTAGVIFLAASAIYSNGVVTAIAQTSANTAGDADAGAVKLLDETSDPFAVADTDATTQPTASGTSVSSTEMSVSDSGTVEIHVNEASLVEVLRMLSIQSQRNIVASKEVKGTVTANLYDVTVREALDAILATNGFGYREKGNFIYVYTQKELDDIQRAERQPVTEIIRLHYATATDVAKLITPLLSKEVGEVSLTPEAKSGLGKSDVDAGGNAYATEDVLVIRDYPDVMDRIKKAIVEIDQRPQQILVEATILRARLSDNNELGINFTVQGGVDFSTLNNTVTALDPTDQTETDQVTSGNIVHNDTAGDVLEKGLGVAQFGGGGLKLGFVKNNVGMFVRALEGVTDTTIMANPKVLVLNKHRGYVKVGNSDGYRDTTTISEGGSSTVGSVKFLETGTLLSFRPYIGDNGYIRLEVHPEDSSGSVNAQGLPSKNETSVTTNVMVKDGRTVVIGGLFRQENQLSRSQVPGLGSIPLIGALFRQKAEKDVREEVIILLTPHIIKDVDGYADASEEQLKDAEKFRVGMRRGMMWFSRQRLAEWAYENAVDEMNKAGPNKGLALWHLNAAINLNPQFMEAINMKQRISGEMVTVSDNSTIRSFVTEAVLAEESSISAATPMATEAPTTQPMEAAAAEAPTTAPATQPAAVAAAAPATQPTAHVEEEQPAVIEKAMTTDDELDKLLEEPEVTVTELPTDAVEAE